MRSSIAGALTVLLLSSASSAAPLETLYAQLGGISGNVLVDRGDGFVPISATTKLVPGNRVLVSGKGSAVLTYGPGCSVPLASDSLTTFSGTESCVIGTQGSPGTGAGLLFGAVGPMVPVGIGVTNSLSNNESAPEPQS